MVRTHTHTPACAHTSATWHLYVTHNKFEGFVALWLNVRWRRKAKYDLCATQIHNHTATHTNIYDSAQLICGRGCMLHAGITLGKQTRAKLIGYPIFVACEVSDYAKRQKKTQTKNFANKLWPDCWPGWLHSGQSQKAIKCCQKLCKHENCQKRYPMHHSQFSNTNPKPSRNCSCTQRSSKSERKRDKEREGNWVSEQAAARWESSRLRTIVCVVQVSTTFAILLNFYLFWGFVNALLVSTL